MASIRRVFITCYKAVLCRRFIKLTDPAVNQIWRVIDERFLAAHFVRPGLHQELIAKVYGPRAEFQPRTIAMDLLRQQAIVLMDVRFDIAAFIRKLSEIAEQVVIKRLLILFAIGYAKHSAIRVVLIRMGFSVRLRDL